MARKVVLSSTAKQKLETLLVYLLEEWSEKVKRDFIAKLDTKINQVAHYPQSCPESKEFKGLFKCVVTSQTTFFTTLFDTRQDPEKLKK